MLLENVSKNPHTHPSIYPSVHPSVGRATVHCRTCTSSYSLTLRASLEPPVKRASFWTVGGNWSSWRKPNQTQAEHANSTPKDPAGKNVIATKPEVNFSKGELD